MSLQIDRTKTALVVIDMTNGVLSLESKPHPVQEVLANTVRLVETFRHAGSFVVLVNVNSVDGKDLLHPIADAPMSLSVRRTADSAQIVKELGPQPTDHLITKRQWGTFFGTDLDLQLRRRGLDTIVLCGIATSFGVETTAREAYQHGYNQIFAEDAINAITPEEHQYVCSYIFPKIGRVRSTSEILAAMEEKQ